MYKLIRFISVLASISYFSAVIAEPAITPVTEEAVTREPVTENVSNRSAAVEPVSDEPAAKRLGYTFLSADHLQYEVKVDGVPDSLVGSGLSLEFSIEIRPHIAIIGSFARSRSSVSIEGMQFNAKIDSSLLGLVIHAAINDSTDFIIGTGFINGKANVTESDSGITNSVDADGGMAMIGIRALLAERLEVSGFLRKTAIEETTNIGVNISIGYYVDENLSLDLGYLADAGDGSKLWTWGATKYF